MLEDLDSLAARIGQLVQSARQMQAERANVSARLKLLEQERDSLRAQLLDRETQYASMNERVQQHDHYVDQLRAEFQREYKALQEESGQMLHKLKELQRLFEQSQDQNRQLRAAAEKSRVCIDSLLERLPGPQDQQ